MFLEMQDFDFCPNTIKFYPFYLNLPKFAQFSQILPKFAYFYLNVIEILLELV